MNLRTIPLLFALILTAGGVQPQTDGGRLQVPAGWARATPPGATVAAVYLTLDNASRPADRLLSVSSPRARRAEVHQTSREGDVTRMRAVDPLHLGAGQKLVMRPDGTHIMLFGLTAPLRAGERIGLVLRFEAAGEIAVEATVLPGTHTGPHAGHAGH